MEKPIRITKDRAGEFRVTWYNKGGHKLGITEGYKRKAGAKRSIYRSLYLEKEGPYSTILRLVKDKDTDGKPTYHFRIIGRNNQIVMHSISVPYDLIGQLANDIMAIADSFDPDTMTGTELYEDLTLKPKKAV